MSSNEFEKQSDRQWDATLAAYTGLLAGDGTHRNDAKAAIRAGEKLLDEYEAPQTLVMNAKEALSANGKEREV